jgi:hypothetical protein
MGDTLGLWEDSIQQEQPFSVIFPNLYDYVLNKKMSVQAVLSTVELLDLFRLPMTRSAYNEFLLFKDAIEPLRSDMDQTDIWVCNWNGGLYSSRWYYKYHFKELTPPAPFSWIWRAKSMPKIKIFTWLLLVDRLNTRDMLRRRGKHLEEGYYCVLCPDQSIETSRHLFFECSSSVARWFAIGIQWEQHDDVFHMIQHQRDTHTGPYFMDLFMISAWCIWKERNDFIFNFKNPSLANWKQRFKNEVKLHLSRLPSSKHGLVMNWLNSLYNLIPQCFPVPRDPSCFFSVLGES